MAAITTTGTLTAGNSRTFDLAPGSALTLTLLPNCRVTVTETPETVSASDAGGNSPRSHFLQYGGVVTYGPYAMGGSVVVENAANSGSTVTWGRKDTTVSTSSDGLSLVSGDGIVFRVTEPNDWMRQSGGVVQSAVAISTTVQVTLAMPVATTRVRIAWQNSGSAGALAGTERLYIGANEANAVAGLLSGQDSRRRLYTLAPGEAVVLLSSAPISTLHFSASASVLINTHSIDVSYEQVTA